MKCPKCGNLKDKVTDSRSIRSGAAIRRRRTCLGCGNRFTTYEEVARLSLRVIKRDGTVREFDRGKLESGIQKACVNTSITQQQVNDVTDFIIARLQADFDKDVPATEIGKRVMEQLHKLDDVAFVRFASVYRRYKNVDEYMREIEEMIERK